MVRCSEPTERVIVNEPVVHRGKALPIGIGIGIRLSGLRGPRELGCPHGGPAGSPSTDCTTSFGKQYYPPELPTGNDKCRS